MGSASATPAAAPVTSEEDAAVPISPRNPTWGSRLAPVTIVEFGDFECPFSERAEATLSALRAKYGSETLRIVWKNNPLEMHHNARPAAIAAMGVFELGGPSAFWIFHDALFGDRPNLGSENYERLATEAGVTRLDELRAGLAANRWADQVDADLHNAKLVGAIGTPAFFVNGIYISGAQPFEKFTTAIDAELTKAKSHLAAGTAPARLYAEVTRLNRDEAEKAGKQEAERQESEDTTTVFKIPVGTSPVRGPATALVTLVEFGDFQCPFCAKVEPTLEALRTKYGDKLRIVWKNEPLPFHPRAEPAAQAALDVRAEAGDAAFWSLHDLLFASQKDLSDGAIAEMATKVGATAAKVRAAMSGHKYNREIDADGDVADDFQIQSTPNFFINGRHMVGAQPQEEFEKLIDEEIAKAQDLRSKGTAATDLYGALTKDGKGPAGPETKDLPASVPPGDPVRGDIAAKVTVHEWASFQCPYCKRVEPTVAQILKDYGKRVNFVWHDLPLPTHADAPLAAQAAREAFRQEGTSMFWSMHDKLFGDQTHVKRADLDGYARGLGLDMGAWASALDSAAHASEVEADAKAASSAAITATPAFLIVPRGTRRGYFVSGAQPFAKFRKLIDRALAEAPGPEEPLSSKTLRQGSGPAAKEGDTLQVHYVGTFLDGTEFDSSIARNKPFEFKLGAGQVIKGWEQGLVAMKAGEKRKLVIPPSLAYGPKGRSGIPPNSTLVFEVELLAIHPN
jgi:protein-disulfide isomerase